MELFSFLFRPSQIWELGQRRWTVTNGEDYKFGLNANVEMSNINITWRKLKSLPSLRSNEWYAITRARARRCTRQCWSRRFGDSPLQPMKKDSRGKPDIVFLDASTCSSFDSRILVPPTSPTSSVLPLRSHNDPVKDTRKHVFTPKVSTSQKHSCYYIFPKGLFHPEAEAYHAITYPLQTCYVLECSETAVNSSCKVPFCERDPKRTKTLEFRNFTQIFRVTKCSRWSREWYSKIEALKRHFTLYIDVARSN